MRIQTKREKLQNLVVGVTIVFLAVVFSCIAICTKEAAIIEVGSKSYDSTDLQTVQIVYTESKEETKEVEQEETTILTEQDFSITDTFHVFFPLSEDQRYLIERVVMAEAGNEPGAGIIGVANCLYNAMLRCEGDPYAAVIEYGYTNLRKTPNEDVKESVCAVFDRGELIFDDDVLAFCRSDSKSAKTGWHSTLELVCTIGNLNFYRA